MYPGYGFLSENPDLASACVARDLTFVGPPAEVLERVGDKVRARAAAIEAGLPVLRATELLEEGADVVALAEDLGMPVFVKAAHGGGGRGMRLVTDLDDLEEAVGAARREAESAFGNSAVYLERAMVRPRHIEVQVLADGHGGLVHLFERDCSVQRRHQKVVEIAPAPNLDPEFRDRICADAVQFAEHVGYVNAGTVEFLVDDAKGEHVFIEMNPRIQVEHTVTEETTDVDLVRTQLLVAEGARLNELEPDPGQDPPARLRAAVPDHDGGPRAPGSVPTPARSRPTARRAAQACASTRDRRSSARRSPPTSTRSS